MQQLVHPLTQYVALSQIRQRDGEQKLAQTADFCSSGESWQAALARTKAAVVVVGIPSDIGVRSNFGKPGCANLWAAAVTAPAVSLGGQAGHALLAAACYRICFAK